MNNRRHFLQASLAAIAATPVLSTRAQDAPKIEPAQPEPPPAPEIKAPGLPMVTALRQDGVSIVWGVSTPSTGWVEYGETPELGKKAYGTVDGLRPFDPRVIAIPLDGLKPGATIHYRTVTAPIDFPNQYKMTRGEPVVSPTYSFNLPGPGSSTKIAVWNDTHQQIDTLAAVRKLTEEFAPSLLVWNGDVVADQFMLEEDLTETFLYPKSASGFASSRPLLYSRGNHDVRGAVARDLPAYMPRAMDHGYQNLLRIGPVGILVLDTGEDKEGPQFYGDLGEWALYRKRQLAWLEQGVNDPLFKDAPHKILFCHIPLRWKDPKSKGSCCSDGDQQWSAVLAKAGVKAVFSGHTHEFWHDEPKADRPFHQITGGGPQTKSTNWSPTPATVIQLSADEKTLTIEVTEAASRNQLLSLKLDA